MLQTCQGDPPRASSPYERPKMSWKIDRFRNLQTKRKERKLQPIQPSPRDKGKREKRDKTHFFEFLATDQGRHERKGSDLIFIWNGCKGVSYNDANRTKRQKSTRNRGSEVDSIVQSSNEAITWCPQNASESGKIRERERKIQFQTSIIKYPKMVYFEQF